MVDNHNAADPCQAPMLREALRGRRIAITGATGFLGTALAERTAAQHPRLRDGPAGPARPARRRRPGAPGDPEEQLLRPAPPRARRRLRRRDGPPGAGAWPATSASTAWVSTPPARSCWRPARRSSTRPRPSASTRRSTRRRDQPARPGAGGRRPQPAAPPAATFPISSPSPPPTWPAAAGDGRPEATLPDTPWSTEVAWRRRSTPPAGPAPTPTPTAGIPSGWPASTARPASELGRGRQPAAGRQDRTTPRGLGQGPPRRARQGPRPGPGLARRLRLHQVAGRAGPARDPGRPAGHHRPAVDHRVGPGRADAGMDPRLPHGRSR